MPKILGLVSALFLATIAFPFSATGQPTSVTRVIVNKIPTFSRAAAGPHHFPISEAPIMAAGFSRVADYDSFTLYKGPAAGSSALISTLEIAGHAAQVATDLDEISLLGHRLNVDTGLATPAYPVDVVARQGENGLYLVALEGYPLPLWLADMAQRGVLVVEPLPPASYIVYGPRSTVVGLRTATTFVRGVFPMTPAMKVEPLKGFVGDSSPYRAVAVEAFEPTPANRIDSFLESVAAPQSLNTLRRTGPRAKYTALLTDIDVNTLSNFESVYAVTPIRDGAPSSERQALLVASPDVVSGALTLPANSINYGAWLTDPSRNITDFVNTRVAMLDTGFDDEQAGLHPDFTFNGASTVIRNFGGIVFNQTLEANEDIGTHGTLGASVINGWAPYGSTRKDAENYRYGHGLAPTMTVAMDKFFADNGSYSGNNGLIINRLDNALNALAVWGPDVVNHSWNSGGSPVNYCGYEDISQLLDQHTRTAGVLHVVAAGNANESGCGFVRAPATAKNAIAVGATENFTLGWQNFKGSTANSNPQDDFVGTCSWNDPPPTQDGRHIPSFSAQARPGAVQKPDLVAPGLRVTGPVTRETTWERCTVPGPDFTCNGVLCNKNIATLEGVRYGFSAGTSFAAPAVAGAAAVVRKWFANITGNPNADPSPAITKAILLNGARDIAGGLVRNQSFGTVATIGSIPNAYQGLGMLNLARLLDSGSNHYWSDQAHTFGATGQSWVIYPTVVDGSQTTRITLVWTDRYSTAVGGAAGEIYTAVNNLNSLACYAGGFSCWRGNHWAANGTTRSSGVSSSFNEAINNVEEIFIPAGQFSSGQQIYLEVNARNLTGDMDPTCSPPGCTTTRQDFAVFGSNIRP